MAKKFTFCFYSSPRRTDLATISAHLKTFHPNCETIRFAAFSNRASRPTMCGNCWKKRTTISSNRKRAMSHFVAKKTVAIRNPEGLHARPAELFAKLAMRYEAEIHVAKDELRVDAKSILHVLTLGASQGQELVIEANGADAAEAIEALVKLVEGQFTGDETLSQEQSN